MKHLPTMLLVIVIVVAAFSSGFLLQAAIDKDDNSGNGTEPWIELVDDTGRKVSLDAVPERIVSIAPSNTEILYAIGAGDSVVAVDMVSNYPEEAVAKQSISTFPSLDLEAIIAVEPDLVLASGINIGFIDGMLEHDLVVFTLDPKSVSEILDDILLVGQLTDHVNESVSLMDSLQLRIDTVVDTVRYNTTIQRPLVLYDMGDLYTAGPGTFQDDVITMAGGVNLAGETGLAWPQLQKEYVIVKDPNVILYSPWSSFAYGTAPTGLEGLTALSANRYHLVNEDWISRPGPRIVDALEEVFESLHPQVAV